MGEQNVDAAVQKIVEKPVDSVLYKEVISTTWEYLLKEEMWNRVGFMGYKS